MKQRFIDLKVTSSAIQIKNQDCIKAVQENDQVAKTISHYSIGSEIGQELPVKKEEQMGDEEMIKKDKGNCMFSFC